METGGIIKHDIKKAPKTGNWRYMKPEVIKDKCIGCGTCVGFCPEACMAMNKDQKIKNNKGTVKIDYDFCKGCGVCADVCPVKAIRMSSGT